MRVWTQNGKQYLNSYATPALVVHTDTEMQIAQNAHNLVWAKYHQEHDILEQKMRELRDAGQESSEEFKTTENRWHEMHIETRQQIDELTIKEVTAYRNSQAFANPFKMMEEHINKLKEALDDMLFTAEEITAAIEEARDMTE